MSAVRAPSAPVTGAALPDAYLRRPWARHASTDPHDLAAFCRWLADRRPGRCLDAALRGFAATDLDAFVVDQLRGRRGRRRAQATVYRRLLALGRFYAWAAAIGAVAANPIPPERRAPADRRAAGAAG